MKPFAPQAPQDHNANIAPDAASSEAGAAVGVASGADGVLTAQALLVGRPWVGIEHNGQHYRLQTTRAGKLILTK